MPSQRRVRLVFYGVLIAVVGLLFFTSHLRQSKDADPRTIQDIYHKTKKAMDQRRSNDGKVGQRGMDKSQGSQETGVSDEDMAKAMAERLKAAEEKAKNNANLKAPRPDPPSKVNGVGSSAGGQGKKPVIKVEQKLKETDEDPKVEEEINKILRLSPVIIFSKTYCRFSKRAKGVLLEKYVIKPTPYVVELDEHPMGAAIQKRLEGMTGRRTVPNVMVSGKSIGGSDEILELDVKKQLAITINGLSGKRVDATLRFVEDALKKG